MARRDWLGRGAAVAVAGFAIAAAAFAQAPASLPARAYRVTIETGLPHLEENLRYATTQETRCLGGERLADQLADAFPILHHVAFAGCTLGDAQSDGDGAHVTYRLHCPSGSETTGTATWSIETARLAGTFEARLGAKNMTLYQRVTAQAVGACGAAK